MSDQELFNCLIKCGDVATQAYKAEIELLAKTASKSAIMINCVTPEDVFAIGKTDTLERLKRNTLALSMLLKMAKDTADSVGTEIHEIFTTYDDYEKKKAAARNKIIDKQLEYDRKKNSREEA